MHPGSIPGEASSAGRVPRLVAGAMSRALVDFKAETRMRGPLVQTAKIRDPRPVPRSGFTRNILSLSIIALAIAGASAARAGEAAAPGAMTVSVVKAKNACFANMLRVSGTFVARQETLVRPDVEGLQIAKILVEDGARVGVGQPLAQLVRPDWTQTGPAKATVTANANGALIYRELPVGMPVSARGEPMFRIIRDAELELLVELPEPSLARVKAGQTARIETLDATDLTGAVRVILPQIDAATQQGHARISIQGEAGARPGAFATASIDLGQSCGAAVPLSSILYGPQGAVAQVVRGDRVETRPVSVGLSDGKDAEIRAGLAEGETVVARAGAFLRDGDLVRPAP